MRGHEPSEHVAERHDDVVTGAGLGPENSLVEYDPAVDTGPETADAPATDDLPIPWSEIESPEPADVRAEVLADVRAYFESVPESDQFVEVPDDEFIETRWFDFSYLDRFEEVERRWVDCPYAYVTVLYDEAEKEYRYHVVDVALDDFEAFVREDLTRILRNDLMYQSVEKGADRGDLFESRTKDAMHEHAATVEGPSLYKLLYYLMRDFLALGPIEPIMSDPAIEDVSCDGVDVPVFVYHQSYRDLRSNVLFDRESLNSFVVRLAQRAGKHISVSNPLIDASLPDGSRIQLTLGGEISTRGSNFTIRKFADVPYTPVDLIKWNTFSLEQMAYFWLCIENNKSLIFAGGTGSGKTTSMNAVSFFVPPNSKVVSIEDTREITLPHDNWIQSVSRAPITAEGRGEVSMYQLLQASLRQRPEYLLVGEIRTEQRVALTFFQAMATGHTAYTTVHADSVESAINRLQNAPLSVPAQMIGDLDIISIQRQIYEGTDRLRRNMEVAELTVGEDGLGIETHTVFERDAIDDEHEYVAESQVLRDIAEERGWSWDHTLDQLADRETVLQYLVDNDIREYDDVTKTIHTFAKDPEYVLEMIAEAAFDPAEIDDEDVAPAAAPAETISAEDVEAEDEPEPEPTAAPAAPDEDPGEDLEPYEAPGEELDNYDEHDADEPSDGDFDWGDDDAAGEADDAAIDDDELDADDEVDADHADNDDLDADDDPVFTDPDTGDDDAEALR